MVKTVYYYCDYNLKKNLKIKRKEKVSKNVILIKIVVNGIGKRIVLIILDIVELQV